MRAGVARDAIKAADGTIVAGRARAGGGRHGQARGTIDAGGTENMEKERDER